MSSHVVMDGYERGHVQGVSCLHSQVTSSEP